MGLGRAIMDEKLEEFLNELSELTKKYGLYIYGCGCCGSPRIENEDDKVLLSCLQFNN
jgi:hypothetical protein